MEKVFIIATAICFLFALLKYFEMKYIQKEIKPLKELLRDIVIVFISTLCPLAFVLYYQNRIDDFLSVITNTNTLKGETTQVFTGLPDF